MGRVGSAGEALPCQCGRNHAIVLLGTKSSGALQVFSQKQHCLRRAIGGMSAKFSMETPGKPMAAWLVSALIVPWPH